MKPVNAKAAKATTVKTKSGTTTKATPPGLAKKMNTTTAAASTTSVATTTTPTNVWVPNNPVAQKLSTKPNILAKANNVLPLNTDLNLATAGFKNFGQFVAAVNVSQNHQIAFADLKAAMTGLTLAGEPTGMPTVSLGQAIQQFKTGVDAEVEATKAQTLADREIQ